jgi:Tol biopolymer transport system component
LLVVRSSGQSAVKELDTGSKGSSEIDPCVSRDQKLLAFMSDRDSPGAFDLFVANPDGTDARGLLITGVARHNRRPVIGPDGKTFYFLSETGKSSYYGLWATTLAGVTTQLADSGLFTDPDVWGFKRDAPTQATPGKTKS